MFIALLFLIFASFVLFGGHYLLYRSVVSFFGLAAGKIKLSLFAASLALPLFFLAVFLLSRYAHGPLMNFIYILAVSWLAVFINLLMAAGVAWFFVGIGKLTGLKFNFMIFGAGIFIAALLISIHGFWNAFHPQIKNIDVSVKNLPALWRGKTIVQLSDVHLGQVHNPAFMQMVADKVNAQNPDLILITGDLFDGMDGDLNGFVGPLNSLRAKQGIYFVTGNHETYLGLNNALAVLSKTEIKVLGDQLVDIDGLQIVGINFPSPETASVKGDSKNTAKIIASLPDLNKTQPIILLHHAPTNLDEAKQAGVALQLSGHTHSGQIWPFRIFTEMIYGQYYYGLHAAGDFSIYTTNGVGTWGPPMRTGNRPEIPVFILK